MLGRVGVRVRERGVEGMRGRWGKGGVSLAS